MAAANIVFNYVLANAAVARSFSGYFASLCDQVSTCAVLTCRADMQQQAASRSAAVSRAALLPTRSKLSWTLHPCCRHSEPSLVGPFGSVL